MADLRQTEHSGTFLTRDFNGAKPAMTQLTADEVLVKVGDPVRFCDIVAEGCMRTVRIVRDGHRQIGEFLFPGDIFGWDARDRHDFGLEAVTRVTLHRYTRVVFDALAREESGFGQRARALMARQMRRGRLHAAFLGQATARARMARFLLDMSEQGTGAKQSAQIVLPMRRDDIGDYLGLSRATISQILTQFQQQGAINLRRARIVTFDRSALECLSGMESTVIGTKRVA